MHVDYHRSLVKLGRQGKGEPSYRSPPFSPWNSTSPSSKEDWYYTVMLLKTYLLQL